MTVQELTEDNFFTCVWQAKRPVVIEFYKDKNKANGEKSSSQKMSEELRHWSADEAGATFFRMSLEKHEAFAKSLGIESAPALLFIKHESLLGHFAYKDADGNRNQFFQPANVLERMR